MDDWTLLNPILTHFSAEFQPRSVESLHGAGGFSGASFWRLKTTEGLLCLRRWPPEHPTPERLRFIHEVLKYGCRHGFQLLPVPITTISGHSFVTHLGWLWELSPWLSGTADYRAAPSRKRLQNALQALGRFHLAVADYPQDGHKFGPSPALVQRRDMLGELLAGGRDRLIAALQNAQWPEFEARARRVLALIPRIGPPLLYELNQVAGVAIVLQPCLRDVWHDHVLFEGDCVSGLVDFGALRVECVSGDIARLLGSLCGKDAASWQTGLDAYHEVRPLSAHERQFVTLFDRSGTLLSGVNWVNWICVDGRTFPDRERILVRMDEALARLE